MSTLEAASQGPKTFRYLAPCLTLRHNRHVSCHHVGLAVANAASWGGVATSCVSWKALRYQAPPTSFEEHLGDNRFETGV